MIQVLLLLSSRLYSLMEDQVLHLNDMGIPAIAITDVEYPETIQQVKCRVRNSGVNFYLRIPEGHVDIYGLRIIWSKRA